MASQTRPFIKKKRKPAMPMRLSQAFIPFLFSMFSGADLSTRSSIAVSDAN